MMYRTIGCLVLLMGLAGCQSFSGSGEYRPYYELGDVQRNVVTHDRAAQRWFDRGLALCYAFNHEEAVRCFEEAIAADPNCAMAHWGVAYALGPNINNTEMDDATLQRAAETIAAAQRMPTDRAQERELIDALATRYQWPAERTRHELDLAYRDAMRKVYRAYPRDPDIAALYAESLMVLRPWKLWSKDGEPAPETPEIRQVLEDGLALDPQHPALCHFYIHTMEASPWPEKALPYAKALETAMPGAGHMVHMPSHIYIWLGMYEDSIRANSKAIKADMAYLEDRGPYNFYSLYRIHNYHFLVYSAMFDGQYDLAIRTARSLTEQAPPEMVRDMRDFLDAFMPMEYHVMIRFGKWDDILAQPPAPAHLPVTNAVRHYARGIAYASTNRVPEALQEQRRFLEYQAQVPETSILFNNSSADILKVAEQMLAGEIEYRRGHYDVAFAHLKKAVELDDAMNYDEPWGWMQPARHALGALQLEQKQYAQAEAVFRRDLEIHPNNVWSLGGLAECLEHTGRTAEASHVRAQFARASQRSDVDIKAACYCAQAAME
jgi:tetratricopeptide (TPR) repeat protein